MYYADSGHKKVYVITNKELLFLIFIFTSMLVFLYPKALLKQQIMAETSNYNLSMLYLKNLLIHSPNDESLMLILAEQSLRNGERERSLELLEFLHKSKNHKFRKKSLLLAYELHKLNYHDSKDEEYRKNLKIKLSKLFTIIYNEKIFDREENNDWHNEAIFNNHTEATYHYLKIKLLKDPKNIKLLESRYYLAINLKERENSLKYVKELIQLDKKKYEYWLDAYYYMLITQKSFKKAEVLLKGQAKRTSVWQQKLAEFYFMRKLFRKSSTEYIYLFNKMDSYKKKKSYYMKAVEALQFGGLMQESASLAHKYENYYIKDIVVRKFLLKLYMATGNLEYAAQLSKKILKDRL